MPLEALELKETSIPLDFLIDEKPFPVYFTTLKRLKIEGGYYGSTKATNILPIVPHLSQLEVIELKLNSKSESLAEIFQVMPQHLPKLISFSCQNLLINADDFQPYYLALKEFITRYPNLIHFSSPVLFVGKDIPQKNDLLLSQVNRLGSLQSLRAPFVCDDNVESFVNQQQGLKELDLSFSKITGVSVPALSKLKELRKLTLTNTTLTMVEILDLAANLPNLTSLTIQLPIKFAHEHEKIREVLALRRIEVIVIEHKEW